MPDTHRYVLVNVATCCVASQILPTLPEHHDHVLCDLRATNRDVQKLVCSVLGRVRVLQQHFG